MFYVNCQSFGSGRSLKNVDISILIWLLRWVIQALQFLLNKAFLITEFVFNILLLRKIYKYKQTKIPKISNFIQFFFKRVNERVITAKHSYELINHNFFSSNYIAMKDAKFDYWHIKN